jgi:hypothetical protein
MSLFIAQWMMRAGVVLPVVIAVTAAIWLALNAAGVMKRGEPLDVADMRTWPLPFALGEAAIFGIVFSGVAVWAGDNPALVAAGSGAAACVAMGFAHLWAGRRRPSR